MKSNTSRPVLTLEAARFLVDQAVAKATETGMRISVAVLDHAGRLRAFASMDDAAHVSLEGSIKKAKTAMGFGLPTGDTWYQFIKDDPILLQGAQHLPDFILLGGGSPLMANGALIGAIGVSGGHYAQDEKCVKAAIEALQKLDPEFGA